MNAVVKAVTRMLLVIAAVSVIVEGDTYTGTQALVGLTLDAPTFTSTADAVITINRCHVTGLIAVQDSSRVKLTIVDSFIDSFYTWSLTSGNATIRNTVVAGSLRVGSMATNSHLVVDNVTMNYDHSGLSTGFHVASVIGGGIFIKNSRFTYTKNGFPTSSFFNVGSCSQMVLSVENTVVNLTTVGVATGSATAFTTAALTSSTLNMTDVSILFSAGSAVERTALDVKSTMATSTEVLHNVTTTGTIRHRYILQSNVSAHRLFVDGAPYIVCQDSAGSSVKITSSRFTFAPVDTTGAAPVAVTGNVGTMSFDMDGTVIDAICTASFSGSSPPCSGLAWPSNQLDRMPLISLTNNVVTVTGPQASAAVSLPRITSSGRLVVAYNEFTVSSALLPTTGLYAEELNLDDSYVIDNVITVSSEGNTATGMRVNGDLDGEYHLIANNTLAVTSTSMAYGIALSGSLSHINNTLIFDGGSITVVSLSLASYGIYRGADVSQGDISIRNVKINVSAPQADAYGVHWFSSTSSTFELNRNEIAVSGAIASTRHVTLPGTWPSALVHLLENNFTSGAAAVEAPALTAASGSAVTRCNIKEGTSVSGRTLLPSAISLTAIPCGANVCILAVDCNGDRADSVSFVTGAGCVCQCAPHLGGSALASAVSRPLQCSAIPELPQKSSQQITTTTTSAPTTTIPATTTATPVVSTTTAVAENTTTVVETTGPTSPPPTTIAVPTTDQISTAVQATLEATTVSPVAATLGPEEPTTTEAVAVVNGTEPVATAVPKAVSQATQGGAIVAGGGVAASSGSPAWAGHASRNALLASLGVCPQPLDGDEPLELMLNPTTLALGTGATRQYQGALAANCAIVFGIPLLQLFVATVARCVSSAADDASDSDRFAKSFTGRVLWAKLPRANYVWFLLLVHPITQAGLILAGRSPDRPDLYLAGAAAFVTMAGLSVLVAVQITGERLKAVFVPRRWTFGDDEDAVKRVAGPADFDRSAWEETTKEPPSNIFTRLFTPVGDWYPVDPGSRHATVHHGMFKPLYGPFRRHGRLFVLGEIIVALVFGIAGAMVPVDQAGCITQMAMLFSSMCLYMLFGLVARPFAEPIDNIILGLLSLLETADCFCLLLVVTTPEETEWAVAGSDWCAWLATWVTFLALAKDCALAVGRNILKARERATAAEVTKTQPHGSADGDEEPAAFSPNPIVSTAPFGLPEQLRVDPELLQAAEAEICEAATADNADAWVFDDTVEYMRFVGPGLGLEQPILWDDDSGHYFHGAVSMWFDPFNELWYSEPGADGSADQSVSDATEAATVDKA